MLQGTRRSQTRCLSLRRGLADKPERGFAVLAVRRNNAKLTLWARTLWKQPTGLSRPAAAVLLASACHALWGRRLVEYGYGTNPLSHRCERRRVGLRGSLFDLEYRRCAATNLRAARIVQWLAPIAARRGHLAVAAARFAALVDRVRPNPPPASRGRVWTARGSLVGAAARGVGARTRAVGSHFRQPDAAIHAGVGTRAGYDGGKGRNGSKVHMAVDTMGHLLTLLVTAANEGARTHVGDLAAEVQEVTGGTVELVYVDQGYTGKLDAAAAAAEDIRLAVIKQAEVRQRFMLLPRR